MGRKKPKSTAEKKYTTQQNRANANQPKRPKFYRCLGHSARKRGGHILQLQDEPTQLALHRGASRHFLQFSSSFISCIFMQANICIFMKSVHNTNMHRRTSGSEVLLTNERPSCKHSTAIGRKCSPSVRANTPRVSATNNVHCSNKNLK